MTTKARSWTDAYEDQPDGDEDKRRGDDRIREKTEDIRQRLTEEHFIGPDDPIGTEGASGVGGGLDNDDPPSVGTNADLEGRHREGSARCHRITAAEADPTLNANHSFGRLLVREAMSGGRAGAEGTYVGDAAAGWDALPIVMANMVGSAHFHTDSLIRKFQLWSSSTVHIISGGGPPPPYISCQIDDANTVITYTPIASGNTLLIFHFGKFQMENSGTVVLFHYFIDATFIDTIDTVTPAAPVGVISEKMNYRLFHTLTSAASHDIAVKAAVLNNLNQADYTADTPRYTFVIEIGNSTSLN